MNITGALDVGNSQHMRISSNFLYIGLHAINNTTIRFYNPLTPTQYSQSIVPSVNTLKFILGASSGTKLFCKYSTDGALFWICYISSNTSVVTLINISAPSSGFVYLTLRFKGRLTIIDKFLNSITVEYSPSLIETTILLQFDSLGNASVVGRITT